MKQTAAAMSAGCPMLMERLDVGTAGYRVGYQSPSQSRREYSRLYGFSPMRDVIEMQMAMAAG
jgi:AraC-like DNA-binding protein